MTELWVEKYRPTSIQDYVFRDEIQKTIIEKWIADKNIPHILFSGVQGTGKSSLINVLIHELEITDADILYINASEETSVEVVREKIINFASTIPWNDFKICILEEADAMSRQAQNSLKRVFEDFSLCRFILTTNNPHKIDPAIFSRCQGFHVDSLNEEDYIVRMATILNEENIEFDVDILLKYAELTRPDLRKAVGLLQQNSINGVLQPPSVDSTSKLDYMPQVVKLIKKGDFQQARSLMLKEASYEDYLEIYRFLYKNLELWSKDQSKQDEGLLIVRDGLYKDGLVADREINLSATLVQLFKLSKS